MLLVTWNVLADAYVKPERYADVAAGLLSPPARRRRIIARAAGLGADVLCLQEVDASCARDLTAALAPLGYAAQLARKLGGKPDGCATFVRCAGDVRVESTARHVYEDGSGHVALLVTISCGGRSLLVANTHFKWDEEDAPEGDRWPVLQAESLARVLLQSPFSGPAVVCGDLNVRPGDAALVRLQGAGFQDPFDPPDDPATCCFGGRSAKIDHVLVRGLAATGRTSPTARGLLSLPSKDEPSDHLPLAADLVWP